jgi:hypothetical protein
MAQSATDPFDLIPQLSIGHIPPGSCDLETDGCFPRSFFHRGPYQFVYGFQNYNLPPGKEIDSGRQIVATRSRGINVKNAMV